MKTKNNTQKTAFAAIAATGLIIFSLTVNAQFSKNSLFFDSGKNNYTMAMNTTDFNSGRTMTRTNDFSNANAFAAYLVEETEEPLKIEDWMIADFGSSMMDLIVAETESPMEIEDWMTNESNFDVYTFSLNVESEEEIEIENWMLNDTKFEVDINVSNETKPGTKVFSTTTFIYQEVINESKLTIEEWMVNPKVWK